MQSIFYLSNGLLIYYIPLAVISAMGLTTDGETVSREVRLGDLLADGSISVSEYHALSKAGIVFVSIPLFEFTSVRNTPLGWICRLVVGEHEDPQMWIPTLSVIEKTFPGGEQIEGWVEVDLDLTKPNNEPDSLLSLSPSLELLSPLEMFNILETIIPKQAIHIIVNVVMYGYVPFAFSKGVGVFSENARRIVMYLTDPKPSGKVTQLTSSEVQKILDETFNKDLIVFAFAYTG